MKQDNIVTLYATAQNLSGASVNYDFISCSGSSAIDGSLTTTTTNITVNAKRSGGGSLSVLFLSLFILAYWLRRRTATC